MVVIAVICLAHVKNLMRWSLILHFLPIGVREYHPLKNYEIVNARR